MVNKKKKCQNEFCRNTYTDVICGPDYGAVCVPCFYADQMVNQSRTMEDIESTPHLKEMFLRVLSMNGWTWSDLQLAFQRMDLRRKNTRSATR